MVTGAQCEHNAAELYSIPKNTKMVNFTLSINMCVGGVGGVAQSCLTLCDPIDCM